MTGTFNGRRLFVTGAAKGIGLTCVELFVAEGARIGCFDRDAEALAQLADQFPVNRVITCHGDVSSSTEVKTAVNYCAEEFGGLDGLINSAGVDLVSSIEDTTDEDWRRIFAVNLDGPMHVCRSGMPHLRAAGGGTIVNISSAAGLQPLRNRSAYSASKAGLQMFSKALAMEAAEFGVRVNTVCPGAVDTGLFRSKLEASPVPGAAYEAVRARYALARIADPREIATAVLWLTGPDSSYVTGTAIAVDGGRTFH